MDENRIKEVFSDEGFVKKLFSMETPEEARAALAEKGIEVSVEEVLQLRDVLMKAAEMAQGGGELSFDTMDEAAGGFINPFVLISQTVHEVAISLAINKVISFIPRGW